MCTIHLYSEKAENAQKDIVIVKPTYFVKFDSHLAKTKRVVINKPTNTYSYWDPHFRLCWFVFPSPVQNSPAAFKRARLVKLYKLLTVPKAVSTAFINSM